MRSRLCPIRTSIAAAILTCCAAHAQTRSPAPPPTNVAGIPVNYDEALVGNYTLPDPLVLANGKPVRDAKTWNEKRRPEIVRLFEENEYGRAPGRPAAMTFDVFEKGTPAFDGKALRRQVTVYFSADKAGPKMDLLLYLPAGAPKPVPVLLNISFSANSSTVSDPGDQAGRGVGPRQEKGPRQPGHRPSGGSTSPACSTRASASPPSTTAISTPTFWEACRWASARST